VRGKLTDFWEERPKQSRQQRARKALHAAFSLQPNGDKSATACHRARRNGTSESTHDGGDVASTLPLRATNSEYSRGSRISGAARRFRKRCERSGSTRLESLWA
jgi:hypothetical protein